jgi:hypothetical protein
VSWGAGTWASSTRSRPVIDNRSLKTVICPVALSGRPAGFLKRFFLEAQIAGKLLHPNVWSLTMWRPMTALAFHIAMELVEGDTCRLLRREGRSWRKAVDIAILARTLTMHQKASSTDIKPPMLLTESGNPKIADLESPNCSLPTLPKRGVVAFPTSSPEQLRGRLWTPR